MATAVASASHKGSSPINWLVMDALREAYDEVYAYTMGPPGFIPQHVASVAKINEGVADGAINDVNESHDVAAHGRGGSPSVTGERERRR